MQTHNYNSLRSVDISIAEVVRDPHFAPLEYFAQGDLIPAMFQVIEEGVPAVTELPKDDDGNRTQITTYQAKNAAGQTITVSQINTTSADDDIKRKKETRELTIDGVLYQYGHDEGYYYLPDTTGKRSFYESSLADGNTTLTIESYYSSGQPADTIIASKQHKAIGDWDKDCAIELLTTGQIVRYVNARIPGYAEVEVAPTGDGYLDALQALDRIVAAIQAAANMPRIGQDTVIANSALSANE